jgi:hypothetical protein
MASAAIYATILFGLLWVCFRRKIGFTFALAFLSCLTFDAYLMFSWSHNFWSRDFLLLHHFFLFTAMNDPRIRRASLWFGAAGTCLALAAVAYNPMLLVFLLSLAVLFERRSFRRVFLPYAASGILVIGADLFYLLSPSVRPVWIASMKVMFSLGSYSGVTSHQKIIELLKFMVLKKEPWILLGLILLLGTPSWIFKKLPDSLKTRYLNYSGRFWPYIVMPLVLFWLRRFFQLDFFFITTASFISLGAVGTLVLASKAFTEKDRPLLVAAIAGISSMFCMGMASSNGPISLFWAAPSLIIPFLAFQTIDLVPSQNSRQKYAVHGFMLLFLTVMTAGSLRHQWVESYFDARPSECSATIFDAPLNGIRTTPRRAQIIHELHDIAQNEKFIFSVGIPGIFLFSKVRSSVNSTLTNLTTFPVEVAKLQLNEMLTQRRFPDLIIKETTHTWSWGLSPVEVVQEKNHPYIKFTDCVKDNILAENEAYSLIKVHKDRIDYCVHYAVEDVPRSLTTLKEK